MKKIIVAPDSFKGSASARQIADALEEGIKKVFPLCQVIKMPVADGGEGWVDTLIEHQHGVFINTKVNDPLMRMVSARYGIIDNGNTAVIEMAAASGLTLLDQQEYNPMNATTFGTGELIKDALIRGCRRFLIGIGGSATNDAGTGMLQALGFRFLDKEGNKLGYGGKILTHIEKIDTYDIIPELKKSEFVIACDVNNPFSGIEGAAHVFAPQKGANDNMVLALDKGLKHFAIVIEKFNGKNIQNIPCSGAAGGLGGAFKAFLDASLLPGIDLVLDVVEFEKVLENTDLVITGEGRIDTQTLRGKTSLGVLKRAKRNGIPVIAVGGSIEAADVLNEQGFTAVFSIQPAPVTLTRAMETEFALNNVKQTISQLMRLIQDIRK